MLINKNNRENNYNKVGFTLIELIVVIVIIGILAAIVIPRLTGFVAKANDASDISSLKILNSTTSIYGECNNSQAADIFSGISTDSARIQTLITQKLLSAVPVPKKQSSSFAWNIAAQTWSLVSSLFYDFANMSLNDFILQGAIKSPGANWGYANGALVAKSGLIFFENPKNEYTISTNATMNSASNGYGISFDTKINSSGVDTGLIFQFDKGLNALVIRPRIAGNEKIAVATVAMQNLPPNYWTTNHQVDLKVVNISPTQRKVQAFIDGSTTPTLEYTYANTIAPGDTLYAGLRGWTGETAFNTVEIKN